MQNKKIMQQQMLPFQTVIQLKLTLTKTND